ncbi:MAG: Crp/Fnr family transcriptional regulator [Butyrivibrio sp.]|jgi:CRP-like cAMP-binding protein|nr:Crp/Fnr family transcriptional regulator [Butyrivibrio sp.]
MAQNNTVYTFEKLYQTGDVIFKQGDDSKCMYEVQEGRVDLYTNYGTDKQKKIAEFGPGRFFGEMGMVEGLPRSATAVAAHKDTLLDEVTWEVLALYFKKKPARVVQIMQQMGDRLRITTKAAMEMRGLVNSALEDLQQSNYKGEALAMLYTSLKNMDKTLGDNK